MKKWHFFLLLLLLSVFVVILVRLYWIFLRHPEFIRQEVTRSLQKELGLPILVDNLEISLLERKVGIRGLRIRDTLDRPLLSIPSLTVLLAPGHLLSGSPAPQELDILSAELWLTQDRDGSWNIASLFSHPPSPGKKIFPRLRIRDATVHLKIPQLPETVTLQGIQLTLAPPPPGGPGPGRIEGRLQDPAWGWASWEGPLTLQPFACDLLLRKGSFPVRIGTPIQGQPDLSSLLDPWLARAWLRGTARITLVRPGLPWRTSARLTLAGGSLRHRKIPLALEKIKVRLEEKNGIFRLLSATGRYQEQALRLRGHLRLHRSGPALNLSLASSSPLTLTRDRLDAFLPSPRLASIPLSRFELPFLLRGRLARAPGGPFRQRLAFLFGSGKIALPGLNLERISGKLVYDPGSPRLLLRDFAARENGGTVTARGYCNLPAPGRPPYLELRAARPGLEAGPELLARLPPGVLRDRIAAYRPRGPLDLEWRVAGAPDRPEHLVRLSLRGCSIVPPMFRHPITGITGPLLVDTARQLLVLRNLQGRLGKSPVRGFGQISLGYSITEVRFSSRGLWWTRELLDALPPSATAFLRRYRVAGPFRAVLLLTEPDPVAPSVPRLLLSFRDNALYFSSLPFPFVSLRGWLGWTPHSVSWRGIQASWQKSRLLSRGNGVLDRRGLKSLRAVVVGRPCVLDAAAYPVLPPEFRALCETLQLDLRARAEYQVCYRRDGAREDLLHLAVEDGALSPPLFPGRFSGLRGDLWLQPDRLWIRELVLPAGQGSLVVRGGTLGSPAHQRLQLTAELRRFPPHPELFRALRRWLPGIDLPAGFSRPEVLPPSPSRPPPIPPSPSLSGTLHLTRTSVPLDHLIEISGTLEFQRFPFSLSGDGELTGRLPFRFCATPRWYWLVGHPLLRQFRWRQLHGRNLSWLLTSHHRYLFFDRISGLLLGGKLQGRTRLALDVPGTWEAELALKRAKLSGWGTTTSTPGPLRGLLDASLSLAGCRAIPGSLRGTGQARLRQGKLWSLPPFLALIDLLEVPEMSSWSEGEARFRLKGDQTILDRLRLSSTPMSLLGDGEISSEGDLNLLLVTVFAPHLLPRIPVVSDLFQKFQRDHFPIQVTGTYENPRIALRPTLLFRDDRPATLPESLPP